jgi:hypothetical protein
MQYFAITTRFVNYLNIYQSYIILNNAAYSIIRAARIVRLKEALEVQELETPKPNGSQV